uniref:K(+) efflux antiporter 2, chloroplastic n=1 Tax=Nicotiana tabacum TaxID=4097 RepID=A0A1S4CET6_TOBAC
FFFRAFSHGIRASVRIIVVRHSNDIREERSHCRAIFRQFRLVPRVHHCYNGTMHIPVPPSDLKPFYHEYPEAHLNRCFYNKCSERVAVGRALDLPVYFGDAGSREVLHKVGAERACAAAITLDTPGANYRTVWALSKYFPNVKTFVRAHDVDHGLNLEKAGATAVVPETLEPSLQLAAAVLAQAKLPMSEIAATINEFRSRHLSELTELCETSGSSLGYGFSRVVNKGKVQPPDSSDENQVSEGTLAI